MILNISFIAKLSFKDSADYFGSAFGNSVEATSTQPSLSASPKSYLLMSSTFLANAQLTGILINGKTAGSISLKVCLNSHSLI